MKLQTRSNRSTILTALVLCLTFGFLLMLSQGFVVSGDDWHFTSRQTDKNLMEALYAGYRTAKGHFRTTNGRLLGNAFSALFGCSELWREVARCGFILVILVQLCRLAKVRDLTLYALALMMTVALPNDIYAQSYAWAAGFFNYVPPIVLILPYLFRAARVLDGQRDSALYGMGMFLTALMAQFFVENVTIGMCLLSAGVLIWHLIRARKLSWSLCGYLAGAVVGCVIMFAAPGYANVNVEGYRQVSSTFEELMKVIKSNFGTITMYLTERNWRIIAPLTGLAICLLLRSGTEKKWLRTAALTALMGCPVYFFARYEILRTLSYAEWVAELSFWLDVLANLLYLAAVLTAALLGLRDGTRRCHAVLLIAAVPMIFGPLVVVYPIGPRCMYIPYMFLAGLVLIFAADLLADVKPGKLSALRIPVVLMVVCVLTVYLWIAVWNGHCEDTRITQIEKAMEAHSAFVEMPNYPYPTFIHNPNGGAIKNYYFYETAGDLEFRYVNHKDWYLSR